VGKRQSFGLEFDFLFGRAGASVNSAPSRCLLYLLRLRDAPPQKDAAAIAHANPSNMN